MDKCFVWINEGERINIRLVDHAIVKGEILFLRAGGEKYPIHPEYRDRVLAALDSLTDDGVRGPRR